MKKIVLLSALFIASISTYNFAQTTATNFNCNDCSGASHDLFSELNSGKVIVIAWVMPCGGCINGALSAYSAVESFASSNPGEVLFYLVDDVANTSCSSLVSWGNTNGMTTATSFSNAQVNMGDYGAAGMPKVVVLAGANHSVFYNVNNSAINQTNITTAINSALATSSINEMNASTTELVVYPNPSSTSFSVSVESLAMHFQQLVTIELKNSSGETVMDIFKGSMDTNEKNIEFNTNNLSNGNYYLSITDGKITRTSKIVVAH